VSPEIAMESDRRDISTFLFGIIQPSSKNDSVGMGGNSPSDRQGRAVTTGSAREITSMGSGNEGRPSASLTALISDFFLGKFNPCRKVNVSPSSPPANRFASASPCRPASRC